ncbi:MAG: DUF4287 domain-containing protein [Devosia nanyangense]|jgi:hypothetical protein|nr:DUF4287 domain-containing protein [Devosia nanyangense]
MSFQAYLDTIKEKTGKGPSDFIALARAKGFLEPGTKATQIVDWLKDEYDLGRGHAMAIVAILKDSQTPRGSVDERIEKLFRAARPAGAKPMKVFSIACRAWVRSAPGRPIPM